MQKAIKINFLSLIIFPSTFVIACNTQDKLIPFTGEDMGYFDTKSHKGLVDDVALDFMYALPKSEAPQLDRDNFGNWEWTWDDKYMQGSGKIIGVDNNWTKNKNHKEYWQLIVEKSVQRGIFVKWWHESDYNPWKQ